MALLVVTRLWAYCADNARKCMPGSLGQLTPSGLKLNSKVVSRTLVMHQAGIMLIDKIWLKVGCPIVTPLHQYNM
eukprot:1142233-Pelagomonas_calceolata.AAC.1